MSNSESLVEFKFQTSDNWPDRDSREIYFVCAKKKKWKKKSRETGNTNKKQVHVNLYRHRNQILDMTSNQFHFHFIWMHKFYLLNRPDIIVCVFAIFKKSEKIFFEIFAHTSTNLSPASGCCISDKQINKNMRLCAN